MPCLQPCRSLVAWYNVRTDKTEHAVPAVPYFASSRTTAPVMLQAFPFASVPLKFDCAVWADADTLHQRVRIVVDPFAAMRRPGFVGAVAAPSLLPTSVEVPLDPAAKAALLEAPRVADRLGQLDVTPAHLFLAVLKLEASAAAECLRSAGIDLSATTEVRGHVCARWSLMSGLRLGAVEPSNRRVELAALNIVPASQHPAAAAHAPRRYAARTALWNQQ